MCRRWRFRSTDLASAGETKNALGVKLRQRARHGLEREAEIVADVAAAHRQRHHAGNGETTIQFEQEGRNPLHRGLAAEQQHVVFGMAQLAGRHGPELAGDLVGRFLDQNMRRRTRAVAGNLAALKAETAAKFVGPDEISQVPVAAIHPGDIVLLRPGERCAVDGTVIEGRSEIDQSLITGETLYVTAEQGTPVYAGSMNISGTLRVRVSAASEATLLAEITRLLDNALAARSRYMRLADRASRLYAPVVHATALITILGWVIAGASWHDAIVTGVAVLIITCPCALGLAIPTVQTVASGAMFKAGVLLNSDDAIERLAEADHVIFDKTGTLTLPDLDVTNAADIPADIFELAGRLALSSHHPVAVAVAQAAGARSPIVGAVEEAGQGVRAVVDGVEIRLGRPSFCGAEDLVGSATLDPEASIVAFSKGSEKFILSVRQGLRPDAQAVIVR